MVAELIRAQEQSNDSIVRLQAVLAMKDAIAHYNALTNAAASDSLSSTLLNFLAQRSSTCVLGFLLGNLTLPVGWSPLCETPFCKLWPSL